MQNGTENSIVNSLKNRFYHSKCYIFCVVSALCAKRLNEAGDAKQELIKIIEESKFGFPLEPFSMYMKILFEVL